MFYTHTQWVNAIILNIWTLNLSKYTLGDSVLSWGQSLRTDKVILRKMRVEKLCEKPSLFVYCAQGKMVVDWVEYW